MNSTAYKTRGAPYFGETYGLNAVDVIWYTDEELWLLYDIIPTMVTPQGLPIIQCGIFCGGSALVLTQGLKQNLQHSNTALPYVVAIDPFYSTKEDDIWRFAYWECH